jgi:hypothetical protein
MGRVAEEGSGREGEKPVKELVKKWRGRHVEPTVDSWYRV